MTALDKQAREYINKLIDDANSESDDPECYICGGMRQLLSDGVAAFATQVREQTVAECKRVARHSETCNAFMETSGAFCDCGAHEELDAIAAPPETTEQERK